MKDAMRPAQRSAFWRLTTALALWPEPAFMWANDLAAVQAPGKIVRRQWLGHYSRIGRDDSRTNMIVDCPSAYVVDGDSLRCGDTRIRLLGIDAPEIERCPRWRVCVAGDGQSAKRSLRVALSYGPVRYQPVTVDRFGRTVAVVYAGRMNLSCWQLQRGQATYKPNWDNGRLIARACS